MQHQEIICGRGMSSDAGGRPEVKGMTGVWTSTGSVFQSMAAATGKERRPTECYNWRYLHINTCIAYKQNEKKTVVKRN